MKKKRRTKSDEAIDGAVKRFDAAMRRLAKWEATAKELEDEIREPEAGEGRLDDVDPADQEGV